jgi:multidrug efflux system outer membrane protein
VSFRLKTAAATLALAMLAGCSLTPAPEVPAPVEAIPPRFAEADSLGYAPVAWWRAFDAPALDRLVDSALVANLDLAQALARVEAARAQFGIARAPLFPSLRGTGSVNYQDQPSDTGFGGAFGGEGGAADTSGGGMMPDTTGGERPSPSNRISFTTYSVALQASYELDLWGRVRNQTRAAGAELLATAADYRAARLAVIGEVVASYFALAELDRQLTLAREAADLLEERLELTIDRYVRGLVSSFEYYQIEQQYRTVQASVPQIAAQRADAEARLALVLGRYAGRLDGVLPDSLASDIPLGDVPVYLPPELLFQRPDVRAAALRLEAARYRVGARRAALLPSVSFTGQLGLQAGEPGSLLDLDKWFTNLTANLTAPIFEGGRLRAQIDAAEAEYVAQAAAFSQLALEAFGEVETALFRLDAVRERYAFLLEQEGAAVSTVELQIERFQQGVGNYIDFLDARRNLVDVRRTLTSARRALADARLGVHRALGGTWVADEDLPPFPPPALFSDATDEL